MFEFGSGGILIIGVVEEEDIYGSWDHVLIRLTKVFSGVDGTVVVNMEGICSMVPRVCIRRAYSVMSGGGGRFCDVCIIYVCLGFLCGAQYGVQVGLWARHR